MDRYMGIYMGNYMGRLPICGQIWATYAHICPYMGNYANIVAHISAHIFKKPDKTNEHQWFLIWAKLPI